MTFGYPNLSCHFADKKPEHPQYRLCGASPQANQSWVRTEWHTDRSWFHWLLDAGLVGLPHTTTACHISHPAVHDQALVSDYRDYSVWS